MENSRRKNQLPSLPVGNREKYRNRFRSIVSNHSRKNKLKERQEHTDTGDSVSEISHDQDISISDSESGTYGCSTPKLGLFSGNGLIRLEERDKEHDIIKNKFILGMGSLGKHTTVVAVHKNSFSSFQGQARLLSFRIFSEATTKKCNGNANIKYAWYGTSSDGINRIISHGFGLCGTPENSGLFGSGLYLSPENHSIDSEISSVLDESGLRHVLLCRVILGNMEEVRPDNGQFHPSSEDFDSGVDNLLAPRRYIIWSSHMNTHILPEYVISFRAPCLKGMQRIQEPVVKPTSAWMPFLNLISVLARFLPAASIASIEKYHSDYRAKKITRQHLIQRVRQIAGDKLLATVIKSCRDKQLKAATGSSTSSSSK